MLRLKLVKWLAKGYMAILWQLQDTDLRISISRTRALSQWLISFRTLLQLQRNLTQNGLSKKGDWLAYKSWRFWDSTGVWFVFIVQLFHQRHDFFQPLDPDCFGVTNYPFGSKTISAFLAFPSHIRFIMTEGTLKCPHVSVSPGDSCELCHLSQMQGNGTALTELLGNQGPPWIWGWSNTSLPSPSYILGKRWKRCERTSRNSTLTHPEVILTQWHSAPNKW